MYKNCTIFNLLLLLFKNDCKPIKMLTTLEKWFQLNLTLHNLRAFDKNDTFP